MFTGVLEVRGLQVLAAAAPPRFQTNLGIPAEDSRKQAGRRPAFLVFGKRAKSPTNRPRFEVVPSREHRKTSEKPNLFLAIDIGNVWLQKALKEAAKSN